MSETQPDQGNTSPWSQPRFIVAGAVLAVIAAAALILAVLGPPGETGDDEPAPGSRPSAAAPTATSTRRAPAGSVCGLPAGSQTIPATAPKTEWTLVGTVAAPEAPDTAGPGRTKDGLRSCYARSPLGALYAAANFLATTSDPTLRLRAAEQLTAKGQGRDKALELLRGADPGGTSAGVQVAGFTFLNYSKNDSVVDLAVLADGQPVHLPISLRWEARDWKVVLPPTGDAVAGIQPLPDLTGYVPWAGA